VQETTRYALGRGRQGAELPEGRNIADDTARKLNCKYLTYRYYVRTPEPIRPDEAWLVLVCLFERYARLDAVVGGAQAVFVGFAGVRNFGVGVVLFEVSFVPLLHGEHGVVGSG